MNAPRFTAIGAAAVLAAMAGVAAAQYRDGEPAVVEAPQWRPPQDPRPGIIGAFARDYVAGGQSRIVLFWAVAFDDNLEVDRRRVTRTEGSRSGHGSQLDKTTHGPAGNATLREAESSTKKSHQTEERTLLTDPSKRPMPFSTRDVSELRQAFLFTMRQGGVSFVDRDVIVRTASAALDSKDVKSVETQAARKGAQYILELLPVTDDRAPTGIGFSVSLKSLESGVETASAYTHAAPHMPPAAPATYVATPRGFELRAPPPPRASMHDIGTALAIDVMRTIGPALGMQPAQKPARQAGE